MADNKKITKAVVFKNLKNKIWKSRAVQPKDRTKYKADVYQVFNLIYDTDENVVRGFFHCKVCSLLEEVNLKTHGNSKLRAHGCFKEHMTADEEEECNNDDDIEEGEEEEEINVSGNVYIHLTSDESCAGDDELGRGDADESEGDDELSRGKEDDEDEDELADAPNENDIENNGVDDRIIESYIHFAEVFSLYGPFTLPQLKPIWPIRLGGKNWYVYSTLLVFK